MDTGATACFFDGSADRDMGITCQMVHFDASSYVYGYG